MSDIKDHIDEQIAGFLTGEISPAEVEALKQWVAASDRNRRYFDEMKFIWQLAGSIDTSATYNPETAWQKLCEKKQPQPRSYSERPKVSMSLIPPEMKLVIRRTLQIAAAVTIIFLAGALTSYFKLKPNIDRAEEITALAVSEYKMAVSRGSKSTIALPDGSIVTLNAASKITYAADYGFSSREVSLEGEAYFDVIKNPEKPFTVHTSHIDIQAFGTTFNVKAYPDDPTIEATLEKGKLVVNSRNDNSLNVSLNPMQNVVYYKDEQSALTKENATKKETAENDATQPQRDIYPVQINDAVNIKLYTSWKDAEWLIESKTLGELASPLERRYNIRILFDSDNLKNFRFSGTIRNETIEQMLNVLAITAPMKYTVEQGVVRLKIDARRKNNYDALSPALNTN